MAPVVLLGLPFVTVNDRRGAKPLPGKALIVVAWLSLNGGEPLDRTSLAEALWPDSDRKAALANFRRLVASVRNWQRGSRQQLLLFEGSRVRLGELGAASDLSELLQTPAIETADALQNFVGLYRGDLLSGAELTADAELGRRILADRLRVQDIFVATALEGARRVGGPAAENALSKLRLVAPADEEVFELLAEILKSRNDRRRLRTETLKLTEHLAREFQTSPQSVGAAALAVTARDLDKSAGLLSTAIAAEAPTATHGRLPRVLLLPPVLEHPNVLIDAFVDDVIISLCRLRTFAMIAPYSAWQIARQVKLGPHDPLGADFVVRTRLATKGARGSGGKYHAFTLSKSATGEVLLGDYVPLATSALWRGQSSLTEAIAVSLAGKIAQQIRRNVSKDAGSSAYALYLRGCNDLRSFDLPHVRRARKRFQQAVNLAPDFAPAIAMLARTWSMEWMLLARPETDPLKAARELAFRARGIDPLAPDGHRELGHAALYLHDFDESLAQYEEALERAPHHADTLVDVADVSLHAGDTDRARTFIDRAIDLNPMAPDTYLWTSGAIDYFAGNPSKAFSTLSRMKETFQVSRLLSAAAMEMGLKKEAEYHRDRWLAEYPDFRVENWQSAIPMRNPNHVRRFKDSLRRAGFK